jgi:hypothetical protein
MTRFAVVIIPIFFLLMSLSGCASLIKKTQSYNRDRVIKYSANSTNAQTLLVSEAKTTFQNQLCGSELLLSKAYNSILNRPYPKRRHRYSQRRYDNRHDQYSTFTVGLQGNSYSTLHDHMNLNLAFPYTSDGNNEVYNHSISLNGLARKNAFSINCLGLEIGHNGRFYGRFDFSITGNNGHGPPIDLKMGFGYNLNVTSNRTLVLRPELGLDYFNRQLKIGYIQLASGSVTINGVNFPGGFIEQYNNRSVVMTFCENVFLFSPSLGLWLWPESEYVIRFNAGYNFMLSQHNSVFFDGAGNRSRQNLNSSDIKLSNTNGQNNNLFGYQGIFAGLSVGFRF